MLAQIERTNQRRESCQGLLKAQKLLLAEADLPRAGSWAVLVSPRTAVLFSVIHPKQGSVNQLQLAKTDLHP